MAVKIIVTRPARPTPPDGQLRGGLHGLALTPHRLSILADALSILDPDDLRDRVEAERLLAFINFARTGEHA